MALAPRTLADSSTIVQDLSVAGVWKLNVVGAIGYNFVSAFSAVGDGATDNSAAWNNFNAAAQANTSANKATILYIPPGTYKHTGAICGDCLVNTGTLRIVGYGATIQATDFNGNPWFKPAVPLNEPAGVSTDRLIQQTNIGDTTVTLVTASASTYFTVGQWVMLSSLDVQYFGFPPNPEQFEFVQVIAINTTTGVLTLNQPIRYEHRTDFPDSGGVGAARVWNLNSTNHPGQPGGVIRWDNVDHTYEGLTVNMAPGPDAPTYATLTGRRLRTINWTGVGHSESVAQTVLHDGSRFLYGCEPDKMVQSIEYRNCEWIGIGLAFQSSLESVRFVNPRIDHFLNTGTVKSVIVDGGNAGALQTQAFFGRARSAIFRNFTAAVYGTQGSGPPAAGLTDTGTTFDGTNYSYANGVIKSLPNPGVVLSCAPGQQIVLRAAQGVILPNLSIGTVTRIFFDGTHINYVTTLPYATLPSWSNNTFSIIDCAALELHNCDGCDNMRMSSEATRRGFNEWEYLKYNFFGQCSKGNYSLITSALMLEMTFNVLQAIPSAAQAGAKFVMTAFVGLDNTTGAAFSGTPLQITINLNTAGKRVITPTGFSGQQTGDTITANGVPQSVWPANFVTGGFTSAFSYDPTTIPANQNAVIEVILQNDVGAFRKTLTTANGALAGTLP